MQPEDHSRALAEIRAVLRAAVPGEAVTVYSADERTRTAQTITQTRQIALAGDGGTDMGQAVIDAAAARTTGHRREGGPFTPSADLKPDPSPPPPLGSDGGGHR